MAAGTVQDFIIASCPGIPENVATVYFMKAVRQFCLDTEFFEKEIELTTEIDEAEYDLNAILAEVGTVHRVLKLSEVDSEGNKVERPSYWYEFVPTGHLKFFDEYIPTEEIDYVVKVVVISPIFVDYTEWDSSEIASGIVATAPYLDAIMENTLYQLKSMPEAGSPGGVPWASEKQAQKHLANYRQRVNQVRQVLANEGKRDPVVSFRRFC